MKVKFVDFWDGTNFIKDVTLRILRAHFEEVEEGDDPDFVFYSVFGYEHLKYDCVRIFITGENLQPDFNICDYGIGFSYMIYEDRYQRVPLYLFYEEDMEKALQKHLLSEEQLQQKTKFCNFVYSNGKAAKERDRMFELLSSYKQVDSGGKYRNNVGGPVEDKYEFQKEYRFSIAFENSSTNGYTTEKLLQAFAAGTIPIYWGDPRVGEIFNEKAFINCHAYSSFDEIAERICEIDHDPELFRQYIKEPIFRSGTEEYQNLNAYEKFLIHIVSQAPEEAMRRNNGGTGRKYQYEQLEMRKNYRKKKKSVIARIKKKIWK